MVELLLEGTWVDITKQVKSVITYDKRVDEVFDTGTFSFESQAITYNIPPLTLCKIDNQYWFASSECNTIIPTEYYNHNVELLELTYIAHTVIIGTKAFSNRGAYKTHNDKLQILVELATSKNQLLFGAEADAYEIEPFIDSKNKEREFTFGAGTSLFIALLEIGKTVDAIPRITGFKTGVVGNTIWHIAWDYLDYNNTFTIDRNRLIQEKQFQDVENYTAMLEAEMQNVVDRDTIVEVKNLTVRSEDFYINSDNQVLLLPSKAEEIVDLSVNLPYLVELLIYYNDNNLVSTLTPDSSGNYYYYSTLKNNTLFKPVINEFEDILKSKGIPIPSDDYLFWHYVDDLGYSKNYFRYMNYLDDTIIKEFNLTDIVLEKAEWDNLLDLSEQPKYFVYESGTNKIENLNKTYKNDLWNNIMDITTYSAMQEYINSLASENTMAYGTVEIRTGLTDDDVVSNYNNPINLLFNVSYKPIIDTYIKSTNTKKPFNESKIKNTSRSFEASASVSDFNLLQNSINKSNEMLGMPEITLTYVGSEIPSPANLIVYRDKNYYVSSVQTTINLGQYTSYINLVSSYSKVAEVFGVASQFESTRLPLTGIIDRFVYCGETSLNFNFKPTGMRVRFINNNGDTQFVYKRGAYVSYEGITYYVVSANDNYCFDTGMVENSDLKGGNYENKQYTYGDENNEQDVYRVALIKEPSDLTLEESRDLSSIVYNRFDGEVTKTITTYKDARERLIFVFKAV